MKKIDTFIEGQMSPDEQDAYLQEIISAKFDAEYKAKWGNKLRKNNIYRSPQKKTKHGFILAIAASLCLLIASIFYFNQVETTSTHFADIYLTTDIYSNPAIKKGTNNTSQKELLAAAAAFNSKDWKIAQEKYLSFVTTDEADSKSRFYLALSYFYDKQFDKSTEQFSLLDSTNFRKQEVNWFYGLSLYHNNQIDESKKAWSKIKEGEWKYEVVHQNQSSK